MDVVLLLLAWIGLPLLLYLVLSYYYPIWKKAFKDEPKEEKKHETN